MKIQRVGLLLQAVIALAALYLGIAFAIFQWRNPLANEMSIWRDFGSVVRFEKLDGYQIRTAK